MKNSIKFILSGLILSVSLIGAASAQQEKSKMLPVVTITSTKTNTTERITKSFEKLFGNVDDAKWYDMNKNYLVKFIKDDQEHNALFKKDGELIYHITYGFEKHLPLEIKNVLEAKYPEFTIARTFNIQQDSRKVWLVNLENSSNLILARIENGELQEVDSFKNVSVAEDSFSKVKP